MITSGYDKHIFWAPPGMQIQQVVWVGGWGFWDEAEQLGGGPYALESTAIKAFKQYCIDLNREDPAPEPAEPVRTPSSKDRARPNTRVRKKRRV